MCTKRFPLRAARVPSSFLSVSYLQAQVRIPAQRDDTRHQNYYPPEKDWHPAGLWELQTVIFQCRYRPAPLCIQLTFPALRPPLLCFGNTWYLTDTYWNCNTPMDCPTITHVLQLPHLHITCIEQCPLSALTAPSHSLINQLSPKTDSKAILTQTSHQAWALTTVSVLLGRILGENHYGHKIHQHPRILHLEIDTILLRGDAVTKQQWQLNHWFPQYPSEA